MNEELKAEIRRYILVNPPPWNEEGVLEYVVRLKQLFYSPTTYYYDVLETILRTSGRRLYVPPQKCQRCAEHQRQKELATKCKHLERQMSSTAAAPSNF